MNYRPKCSVAVGFLLLATLTAGLAGCEWNSDGSVDEVEQALAEQVEAALIHPDAFDALGYDADGALGLEDGTGVTWLRGPTTEVCNRELEIDRLTRLGAGRTWHGDKAFVLNTVNGYAGGAAADAVSQVREAVGSCETYIVYPFDMKTEYGIGAPVTLPSYDGIEATFAYCEHELGVVGNPEEVRCSALLAHGNLLAKLSVYMDGPKSEEAVAELLRLTPTAVEALRPREASENIASRRRT